MTNFMLLTDGGTVKLFNVFFRVAIQPLIHWTHTACVNDVYTCTPSVHLTVLPITNSRYCPLQNGL